MSKSVKSNEQTIEVGDLVLLVNIDVYDVVDEGNLSIARRQHEEGIVRHATASEVDAFNRGELALGW